MGWGRDETEGALWMGHSKCRRSSVRRPDLADALLLGRLKWVWQDPPLSAFDAVTWACMFRTLYRVQCLLR